MATFKEEQIKEGKEMMDELTDFFNTFNTDSHKAFADAFEREHRTLQQNVLRGFFNMMVQCADNFEKGNYDARNEGGLRGCKVMVDAFKEKYGYSPDKGMAHI